MGRFRDWAGLRALLLAGAVAIVAASVVADEPKTGKENSNALITAHSKKLTLSASSSYDGWPVKNLIDGNKETSWFSGSNDSAAKGKKPYVEITFPEDVKVNRVTVLGNREPDYPKNFGVLSGKIEFLDKGGKKLYTEDAKGAGAKLDFDFRPKKAVEKVRSVRFTSLKDEGDKNSYGAVALAEMLIE